MRNFSPLLSAITFNIRVKGIASMDNKPNAVHVLYAQMVETDENNRGLLRRLRNELMNYFSKSGKLLVIFFKYIGKNTN